MSKAPKLRFKEFSGDWEVKKLGDVINYKKGYAFKSNDYKEEGVRIIKISDTSATSIKDTDITCISKEEANNYKEWELKTNDIIVSTVGSRPPLYSSMVGKIILIPKECENNLLNQNLVRLRTNELSTQKYLYNYLNSKRYLNYIEGICRGNANQVSITLEDLFEYKIRLPKIEEQEKIASFFSLIDDKISLQGEKVEALKDYKKGMMQKIFSRELRFKDDDGRDYPEWEEKKIGNYIIEYKEKTTENNQYPVLTSAREGIILQKDYFKDRQVTTDDNIGYHIMPRGYITYRSRSDDTTFKFNQNNLIDMGIVSYFYPVFKFTEELNSIYALTYMNNYLESQIRKEIVGTSQLVLSLNKLKELKIQVPSIEEQNNIGNILSSIDKKIKKEQEKLDSLNEYKKGLLQQMFI